MDADAEHGGHERIVLFGGMDYHVVQVIIVDPFCCYMLV